MRDPRSSAPVLRRRQIVTGLGAGLFARAADAAPSGASGSNDGNDEDLRNLQVQDVKESGGRFLLVTPRWQDPDRPVPLVVFLHGLGETGDERAAAYAWVERYGLASSWQRLKRAPLAPTSARGEWTASRLVEVNRELEAGPL